MVGLRLRTGPWWRASTFLWMAFVIGAAAMMGAFVGDPVLLALTAVVAAIMLRQQFTWVSVGPDGITRQWILRKRWGWDEITGIGWTESGWKAWRFRTAGGRWKPVAPWKPLLVHADRPAERRFIHAFLSAASAAGVTPEAIGPWPRATAAPM